jgi:hypothetical protein
MLFRARLGLWCCTATLSLLALAQGCGDDASEAADESGAWVRGRVTDVTGKTLSDVPVMVGDEMVTTDAQGRFEAKVRSDSGGEVQVAVESKKYSSGAAPVKVADRQDSHVEVSVKPRDLVTITVASDGVRADGKDGFSVEVPADGLTTKDGGKVQGEVEVLYTVVTESKDVTAAPGRMETDMGDALEGYGLAEVRFYQGDQELVLAKSARFELPLNADVASENGEMVPSYGMARSDKRWQSDGEAKVQDGKLMLESRAHWVGAARMLPVDSCVSGKLLAASAAAQRTTIRAARARGLSLVQADTNADGSFCLPVTPNDDWSVSTYYDDGDAGLGLTVDVNSSDAVGMCGEGGCKSVGDVALPPLP